MERFPSNLFQMKNKQIKKNNEYVLALYRAGHSLSCIDPISTFFPPRPMAKPVMKKITSLVGLVPSPEEVD